MPSIVAKHTSGVGTAPACGASTSGEAGAEPRKGAAEAGAAPTVIMASAAAQPARTIRLNVEAVGFDERVSNGGLCMMQNTTDSDTSLRHAKDSSLWANSL
jgi:hypothetical protein